MLPPAFHKQIAELLGPAEADALCRSLTDTEPPVSLRINPLRPSPALPAAESGNVPWCTQGRYLQARPKFTYDPLLHAGCYYVQEAASMFIEQAWKQIVRDFVPRRLLDLCAAPGGKSTLWRSLLPDGALLVANDPVRPRAQILAENLTKWGHPDVVATSAYAEEFAPLGSFFDVVAADVPCSGEGMFRKDAAAIDEWSPENVTACAARQWQIVESIWPALRQGGYLVYSTCTFNREENEDNVVRICRELGAEIVAIDIATEWGICGDTTHRGLPVYHFFPHHAQGEGLFLALLRKTAEAPVAKEKKNKKRLPAQRRQAAKGAAKASGWLKEDSSFQIINADENHLVALRQTLADEMQRVCATVHALAAGILLAEDKGGKLVPQHALAVSDALAPGAFPRAELTLEQALAYLRRETITLDAEMPRGYVTVAYQGFVLGFVNNLGTRANNLYPQEWRIRN